MLVQIYRYQYQQKYWLPEDIFISISWAFQSPELNRKEQEELQMLKASLLYGQDNQHVNFTFPDICNTAKLKDNRYQIVGR